MKDTFFFPHDFGARNDPKLQNVLMECGCAGLGIFWCIVEQIYEQGGSLPLATCKSIAFALHVESNIVEKVVNDFDLFENDGKMFWSNSINTRLNKRSEIIEKRKKAAAIRWKSDGNMQVHSKQDANVMLCNAIKEKKRKEKNKEILSKDSIKKVENEQHFTPPLLDEIKIYCSERKNNVDYEKFFNFYESKGWMIGKNKMKDWKAAVRTWEKSEKDSTTSKNVNEIWQQHN